MEFIILGLLMLEDMTIYDLNASFGIGLKMIYSASYGSLQYSVKKLLNDKLIAFTETVENGRNKKIYSVNQEGIKHFLEWMLSESKLNGTDKIMLAKIYFLGLIENDEDKKKIIIDLIDKCNSQLEPLSSIKKQNKDLSLPLNLMKIANFQLATLDYGIGAYKHSIKWLESLLYDLEN